MSAGAATSMTIVLCMTPSGAPPLGQVRNETQCSPGELAEAHPGGGIEGEPGARVGRAADLVTQVATDDADEVDDPDRVEAALRSGLGSGVEQVIGHVDELD